MIATADAPAEITELAFASVIPPIATTGFPRPAAARDELESACVVAGLLRRRREDRTDSDVAGVSLERAIDLFARVRREPDDRVRSDDPSHLGDAEILLSHMHAVGVRKPGDVRPVVDDDPGASLVRDGDHTFGQIQEGSAFAGLVAQLQKSRAATKVCVGDCEWIEASYLTDLGVDDGVEDGALEEAASCQLPAARILSSLAVAYAPLFRLGPTWVAQLPAPLAGSWELEAPDFTPPRRAGRASSP